MVSEVERRSESVGLKDILGIQDYLNGLHAAKLRVSAR